MDIQKPDRVKVALIATYRLAVDLLTGWLNSDHLACDLKVFNNPALVPRTSAESLDLIVLGDMFSDTGDNDEVIGWLKTLRAIHPATVLVVISDRKDPVHAVQCLHEGARGFIPTTLSLPTAEAALRLILSGGVYIPSMALSLEYAQPPAKPRHVAETSADSHVAVTTAVRTKESAIMPDNHEAMERLGLSPRECEILLLLQKGRSNRYMAADLGISENTVMVHVRNVMRKLGATNRTQAVFNAGRLLKEA